MKAFSTDTRPCSRPLARGWGGRDSRSVMLLQQERAGIKIAVDPERLREADWR
jgi:hypothetical protein